MEINPNVSLDRAKLLIDVTAIENCLAIAGQFAHEVFDNDYAIRIEYTQWLVKYNDIRIMQKSRSQQNFLSHAFAETIHALVNIRQQAKGA